MKKNIVKSIFWGISIMIGIIIADIIRGNEVNIVLAAIGGIVMGVIEFIIKVVSDKRNNIN